MKHVLRLRGGLLPVAVVLVAACGGGSDPAGIESGGSPGGTSTISVAGANTEVPNNSIPGQLPKNSIPPLTSGDGDSTGTGGKAFEAEAWSPGMSGPQLHVDAPNNSIPGQLPKNWIPPLTPDDWDSTGSKGGVFAAEPWSPGMSGPQLHVDAPNNSIPGQLPKNWIPPLTSHSLRLTGTAAATSPAWQNGQVEVKCAMGTGRGMTDSNGAYAVAIPGVVLPCMVRVSGIVEGRPLVLHSIFAEREWGGRPDTGVANVTPLTELIIARAAGAMPAALFDTFEGNHARIAPAGLRRASNDMRDALWHYGAHIHLGHGQGLFAGLDPFEGQGPSQPDENRKLLEVIWADLDVDALPHLVNKVASVRASDGMFDESFSDAIFALFNGNLRGCAAALSGRYWFVPYNGTGWSGYLDFKSGLMSHFEPTSRETAPIAQDQEQPCRFAIDSGAASIETVMGPTGVGIWRQPSADTSGEIAGYLFPVQWRSLVSMMGTWMVMISAQPSNAATYSVEGVKVDTSGVMTRCSYNRATPTTVACEPHLGEAGNFSLTPHVDGAFNAVNRAGSWRLYAYRGPEGATTLFGASTGANQPDEAHHFLMGTKLEFPGQLTP